MYNNITVERLEQIQRERDATMNDSTFQRWMKHLNVGRMYVDRQPVHNARVAMSEWNITKLNTRNIHIV